MSDDVFRAFVSACENKRQTKQLETNHAFQNGREQNR
jgi:hypothetical protein